MRVEKVAIARIIQVFHRFVRCIQIHGIKEKEKKKASDKLCHRIF